MPTIKQQRAADLMADALTGKKEITKGEIMAAAGYATAQINPHQVVESRGFQEALAERGFTVENAKKVIGEIIDNPKVKPDTKINAAKEIFKVHGSYAAEKQIVHTTNVNIETDPEGLQDFLEQKERELLEKFG